MTLTIYSSRETDLVARCRRGDRSAQQGIFDLYSPRMYGIALRYLRDPMQAEDALVMAFTRVFEKIHQYKGKGSFEGWIRRIVINESLTSLRKARVMRVETDLEQAAREPDYQALEDHLTAGELLKIIDGLPPGYRVVFNLYAIDGFSHKEIAEQLGISENTSKSQLSRARMHLQKVLASCGWDNRKASHDEPTTR